MTKHTMTVGLDLGDRYSHVFLLADEDEGEQSRVATTPVGMRRFFERIPPARVVLEVGTHSRWVSQQLKEMGHDVIVANPRRVRLITENARKSDQNDPELLARLGRADVKLLSPIEHRSSESHRVLSLVRARDGLVRARTKLINQCRGVAKSWGYRFSKCASSTFHRSAMPVELAPVLDPLMHAIATLTEQIKGCERTMKGLSEQIPEAALVRQVSGVGPVLSLAFVATLEEPKRFRRNRSVGAYLGLCPRRDQSGNADPQLPISKAGDPYLRRLLVSAANHILGPRGRDSDLRRWGLERATRGGKNAKKRAVVGVARKLAVLMLTLWKTEQTYQPLRKAA